MDYDLPEKIKHWINDDGNVMQFMEQWNISSHLTSYFRGSGKLFFDGEEYEWTGPLC